jgi:hydrogenase nickel incorporation protein HypB
MLKRAIDVLDLERLDLIIVENVGNLVCTTDFDLGENAKVVILSVPEGDDKPLKYPLMFSICDVVLINKTDVLPYFDFDMDKCREYVAKRNPDAKVIPICAKTGEGIDDWCAWLAEQVDAWIGR